MKNKKETFLNQQKLKISKKASEEEAAAKREKEKELQKEEAAAKREK